MSIHQECRCFPFSSEGWRLTTTTEVLDINGFRPQRRQHFLTASEVWGEREAVSGSPRRWLEVFGQCHVLHHFVASDPEYERSQGSSPYGHQKISLTKPSVSPIDTNLSRLDYRIICRFSVRGHVCLLGFWFLGGGGGRGLMFVSQCCNLRLKIVAAWDVS